MKKKTKKIVTKIFLIIAIVALVAAVFVPPIYYIVNGIKSRNSGTNLNVIEAQQEHIIEEEK